MSTADALRYRSDLRRLDARPRAGDHSHVVIEYGLRYCSGNRLPYFTATVARSTERGGKPGDGVCGACHDLILAVAPDLADIVALHIADLDGAPMHDVENGWHWYDDGSGRGTHLDEYPPRTPFARMSPHERAAHHLRIDPGALPTGLDRVAFGLFVETLRPAWRAEANDVIARYKLDPYC